MGQNGCLFMKKNAHSLFYGSKWVLNLVQCNDI